MIHRLEGAIECPRAGKAVHRGNRRQVTSLTKQVFISMLRSDQVNVLADRHGHLLFEEARQIFLGDVDLLGHVR